MATTIRITKRTSAFVENSISRYNRTPTNDEIREFRERHRNSMKYISKRRRKNKITEEQEEELRSRWENADIQNFKDIHMRLVREKRNN